MVNERKSRRAISAFLPRKYEFPRTTSRTATRQRSSSRRKEACGDKSRLSQKNLSSNGSKVPRNGFGAPNIFVTKVSDTAEENVPKSKDTTGHLSTCRTSLSPVGIGNSRSSDARFMCLNREKTNNGKRVLVDTNPRQSLDERQEPRSSRHRVSSLSIRQLRNMSRLESDSFGTYRNILNLRLADCRRQNYELSQRVKDFIKVIENFKMKNKSKNPWSVVVV